MSSPRWTSVWTAVAGVALVLGGAAWFAKLAVIVATDGRVAYTGAAGACFTLGLALMLPPDGRSVPLVITIAVIYAAVAVSMARFGRQ